MLVIIIINGNRFQCLVYLEDNCMDRIPWIVLICSDKYCISTYKILAQDKVAFNCLFVHWCNCVINYQYIRQWDIGWFKIIKHWTNKSLFSQSNLISRGIDFSYFLSTINSWSIMTSKSKFVSTCLCFDRRLL